MFVHKVVILMILVFQLKFSECQFYFGTTPSPSYNPYQYTTYNPYQYTAYNPYSTFPYNNQYNQYPYGINTGSKNQ